MIKDLVTEGVVFYSHGTKFCFGLPLATQAAITTSRKLTKSMEQRPF
jgi:hypothetical protein